MAAEHVSLQFLEAGKCETQMNVITFLPPGQPSRVTYQHRGWQQV